jgi:predicted methyltransferase
MKNRFALAAAVAGLLVTSYAVSLGAQAVPPDIQAAVQDPNRPKADTDRDAARHPAQMLMASGVKQGDKVVELSPGGGYMSRLFSKLAGPSGHVYAANLPTFNERYAAGPIAVSKEPGYMNVSVVTQPYEMLKLPEPVDVVWTSENYHDFQNMGMFKTDTAAMDKAIFAALKPGGLFIVTDYVGEAGSGKRDTQSLHRIDPNVIKQEVAAAGFVLETESNVLANPSDDHKGRSAQGADQVFYKFRKPR